MILLWMLMTMLLVRWSSHGESTDDNHIHKDSANANGLNIKPTLVLILLLLMMMRRLLLLLLQHMSNVFIVVALRAATSRAVVAALPLHYIELNIELTVKFHNYCTAITCYIYECTYYDTWIQLPPAPLSYSTPWLTQSMCNIFLIKENASSIYNAAAWLMLKESTMEMWNQNQTYFTMWQHIRIQFQWVANYKTVVWTTLTGWSIIQVSFQNLNKIN